MIQIRSFHPHTAHQTLLSEKEGAKANTWALVSGSEINPMTVKDFKNHIQDTG